MKTEDTDRIDYSVIKIKYMLRTQRREKHLNLQITNML